MSCVCASHPCLCASLRQPPKHPSPPTSLLSGCCQSWGQSQAVTKVRVTGLLGCGLLAAVLSKSRACLLPCRQTVPSVCFLLFQGLGTIPAWLSVLNPCCSPSDFGCSSLLSQLSPCWAAYWDKRAIVPGMLQENRQCQGWVVNASPCKQAGSPRIRGLKPWQAQHA